MKYILIDTYASDLFLLCKKVHGEYEYAGKSGIDTTPTVQFYPIVFLFRI